MDATTENSNFIWDYNPPHLCSNLKEHRNKLKLGGDVHYDAVNHQKKVPTPTTPHFRFLKKEMRGRRGWDFFLVVNNIIMNISTKFQLVPMFFEVRLFYCINAADY